MGRGWRDPNLEVGCSPLPTQSHLRYCVFVLLQAGFPPSAQSPGSAALACTPSLRLADGLLAGPGWVRGCEPPGHSFLRCVPLSLHQLGSLQGGPDHCDYPLRPSFLPGPWCRSCVAFKDRDRQPRPRCAAHRHVSSLLQFPRPPHGAGPQRAFRCCCGSSPLGLGCPG